MLGEGACALCTGVRYFVTCILVASSWLEVWSFPSTKVRVRLREPPTPPFTRGCLLAVWG